MTVGASSVGSQWLTRESAWSHHLNSNFLPRRVDGSKQIIKLFLHLSCLFVWHLATTKHNLRARPVLSELARANYGTSVVAECNAWSAGKIPKPHGLQLCAPVTKVRKRGGRPQPPVSEKPGIIATLTKRSQDPTGLISPCCFNVGLVSKTVEQHWNCFGGMPRVYWGGGGRCMVYRQCYDLDNHRCQTKSNDHTKSNDLPVSEQISRDFVRGYKYCVTYRMHKL